jgi:predicted amidophosphoribosyltransferase
VTGTPPCTTTGCRWRSGHPSGLCWDCRTAQQEYLAVLRKPCPLCGRPTAVGFGSPHDQGAPCRRPTKWLPCSTADVRPLFVAESAHPGLRLVAGGAR